MGFFQNAGEFISAWLVVFRFLEEIGDRFPQKLTDSLQVRQIEATFPQFVIRQGGLGASEFLRQFFLAQARVFSCLLQLSTDLFVSFHKEFLARIMSR